MHPVHIFVAAAAFFIYAEYKIRVLSGYSWILDPVQATEMAAYQSFDYSGAFVSACRLPIYTSDYIYRVLNPSSMLFHLHRYNVQRFIPIRQWSR